jgi:pimeloyl-ACP methyl ester carboxylesterase
VIVVALFLLGSCSSPATVDEHPSGAASASPTPSASPERAPGSPVRFRTADGVRIAGRLFGDGPVGVVLGHSIDGDQSEWWNFAEMLAENGYVALSIDFRGYCPREGAGCSGEGSTGDAWQDVLAGGAFLREHGVQRVVVMGSSMGGTAAVVAAAQRAPGLAGVVTLSAPTECCGLVADRALVEGIHVPGLFIAGRFDAEAPMEARALAKWIGSRGEFLILASGEHGTDLFGLATPDVEQRTTQSILDFLDRLREG